MFNISLGGRRTAFEVRFTPRTEAHLAKHCPENPEIQPHFIVQILTEAEPMLYYEDPNSGRYVFEGYLACKPYRVVVELMEEGETLVAYPVSAHRIKEKAFLKTFRQNAREGR